MNAGTNTTHAEDADAAIGAWVDLASSPPPHRSPKSSAPSSRNRIALCSGRVEVARDGRFTAMAA
jgi:hypothetical protein